MTGSASMTVKNRTNKIIKDIQITKQGHFNYESLFAVVLSTAVWRFAYTGSRLLLPTKNAEYCSRIIAFCHGLLVAFVGVNQCFLVASPFEHPEWRTSYVQSFLLVASLGYFIHDLEWIIHHQRKEKLMIAHHAYSVFALFMMLFKGYSGAQACCALGNMEITNPFLQLRWFVRSEGFYPSVLYNAMETSFMIVFLLIRIILGSYIMMIIFTQPNNDWDFILLSLVIYIMSWMFLFNIVKYLKLKYLGLNNSKNNNSRSNSVSNK